MSWHKLPERRPKPLMRTEYAVKQALTPVGLQDILNELSKEGFTVRDIFNRPPRIVEFVVVATRMVPRD